MIEQYLEILKRLNLRIGLNDALATGIAETVAALSLILVSIGLFFLIKFILKKTVYKIIMRSTNQFDDLLIKNKVIGRTCLLIPALLLSTFCRRSSPTFPIRLIF